MKKTKIFFLLAIPILLICFCGCSNMKKTNTGKETPPSQTAETEQKEPSAASDPSASIAAENPITNGPSSLLTSDQTATIAMTHAGYAKDEVTLDKSSLNYENGLQLYSIRFETDDNKEYHYKINAYTGEILNFNCNNKNELRPETETETQRR